jgi:hypothetical protein
MPRFLKSTTKPFIQSCEPRERRKWNFDKVPLFEQEHCYLYEYCLEIPEIIEEVKDYRARQKNVNIKELEEKAELWRAKNSVKSAAEALRPASDAPSAAEQLGRFGRENPELMEARHTNLKDEVAFLLSCGGFPEKHWQQLCSSERKKEAQDRIFNYGLWSRMRGAKTQLSLVAPQELFDFLKERQPKESDDKWDLTESDRWLETVAFEINWNRSITELKKDFHELVENQLRGNRQPFQKSKEVPSRKTPPKAALKMLAAARLLKAYEAALKKDKELLDENEAVIELYAHPCDWRKAARRAEGIRNELAKRLLWRPKPKEAPATIAIPTSEIPDWQDRVRRFGLPDPFDPFGLLGRFYQYPNLSLQSSQGTPADSADLETPPAN